MTKIVYNCDYGGFGLSPEIREAGRRISGNPDWCKYNWKISRTDPVLVEAVESVPEDKRWDLKILDIPQGTKYRIDEYDGLERVITIDEYEWSIA